MESTNSLDAAFKELEETCGSNRTIRREMIEQLRAQIPKVVQISEYDKALMITAKMSVIKTLDDLLKSDEDVSVRNLKLKLARKDSETNGMIGETVTRLLRSIRPDGKMLNEPGQDINRGAVMDELKNMQENNPELAVSKEETEECGASPSVDSDEPIAPLKEEKDEEE